MEFWRRFERILGGFIGVLGEVSADFRVFYLSFGEVSAGFRGVYWGTGVVSGGFRTVSKGFGYQRELRIFAYF